MRVVVFYRKEQKRLKKFALQLKRTLARPHSHDRAYIGKLSTASPGKPVDVMKLVQFYLWTSEKKTKKNLEESTKVK